MLGRQAVATTEYVYEDGQLVRTVTTWEPRWLEDDVGWAKAYLRWKSGQCPGCGLQLSETTAMEDGTPVHRYRVPDPFRCYACDARIKAQDEHSKKGSVREQALLWQIEQDA